MCAENKRYLPIKLGIVPDVFHSLLSSCRRAELGGLGSCDLPAEGGGEMGHIPPGEGVDVDVKGTLFVQEEEDGEMDRLSIECAILV